MFTVRAKNVSEGLFYIPIIHCIENIILFFVILFFNHKHINNNFSLLNRNVMVDVFCQIGVGIKHIPRIFKV